MPDLLLQDGDGTLEMIIFSGARRLQYTIPGITSSHLMLGPDSRECHHRGYAHARLCDPFSPRMGEREADEE
jgi:hypothetical protein